MLFVVVTNTIGALTGLRPGVRYHGRLRRPANATMTVVLHMYNTAFKFSRMGRASAMAFILFAIILVITFIQLRFLRDRTEGLRHGNGSAHTPRIVLGQDGSLTFAKYAIVIFGAIVMVTPFLWMINSSLMTSLENHPQPPVWLPASRSSEFPRCAGCAAFAAPVLQQPDHYWWDGPRASCSPVHCRVRLCQIPSFPARSSVLPDSGDDDDPVLHHADPRVLHHPPAGLD